VSKAPPGILDFVKLEALSDTDSSAVLHTVFPTVEFLAAAQGRVSAGDPAYFTVGINPVLVAYAPQRPFVDSGEIGRSTHNPARPASGAALPRFEKSPRRQR
jgi:hypothetical protein